MSNSKKRPIGRVAHVVKNNEDADVHARLMENLALTMPGQWPHIFALLVKEFDLPVEGTRCGKAACHALVAHALQNAVAVVKKAEQTGVLSPIPVALARIAQLEHIQARFNQWDAEVGRIIAEQEGSTLEKFSLDVNIVGTGSGSVTRSRESDGYIVGSNIVLTASADAGSIFNGWQGDANHLSVDYKISMDSTKVITARFDKLDIPDLAIGVAYDHTENTLMVSGEEVFILYLTFTNHSEKQVKIEIPLSVYASSNGEEIEQSVWLSGLVNGNKSCTIRAGAFRTMGLVFLKSKLTRISTGDHLQVTVIQKNPSCCLHFSFRCTHDEARSFILIDATANEVQAPEETIEIAEILRRMGLMEENMGDMRRKLDALQAVPMPSTVEVINRRPPENTLREVVAWLATQDRIAVSTLRIHLLPLDLLPTAIIDKLNDRALDLTGELALKEFGDEVVVTKEILDEVLANWDAGKS
jgi:hypothetical protein